MTATKTAPAKTEAKAKVQVPKHKLQAEVNRKVIRHSVTGKATSVRNEDGKKDNRKHTVKYMSGKRTVTQVMRIIYGRELLNHTEKNVTELTNSKGSVYYFVPVAK